MRVKLKTFPDTEKLREIVASIPVSQEILKEALQSEGKITTDSTLEIQEEIKGPRNGKYVGKCKKLYIIFSSDILTVFKIKSSRPQKNHQNNTTETRRGLDHRAEL